MEADQQNRAPPHMSTPFSECLKEEVLVGQTWSNPSFNGLQKDREMGWHEQIINEELWMSFLGFLVDLLLRKKLA